ncbi:uncharacterized protein F4812DRAFT_459909 [Daldinia caldariorum]|uniref:uncharacterized protein n=1 Tax=Daldinia caldariorum TaxID=326644 RepID=UPI002007DBE4|nr:uncharacterized protein F4812DRAFT_459909 [Daldinia caldariorum]KAI1467058.1 hypothetical protein F4812DRAFT_459909 [Daldinia caldariorum]
MSTMRSDLGLSCPSKGKFYVCEKASIRFIGCCTVDPCADGSGHCPQNDLAAASFSSDHYDSITEQSCAPPNNASAWFTCKSSQPFLGCCSINPCEIDGCPTDHLLPAILSDNATSAEVFLSSSSTPSSDSGSGYSLPLGAILGIALGGAAVVAILLVIIAYRCGWLARNKRHKKGDEVVNHFGTQGPQSPGMYQWQNGSHSGAPSPGYPSPGYSAYSPNQHHQHPNTPHSPQSAEPWHGDNRHTSQISGVSGWTSVTDQKHQSYSPLLGPPPIELEGRETERRIVAELPSSPATNHGR